MYKQENDKIILNNGTSIDFTTRRIIKTYDMNVNFLIDEKNCVSDELQLNKTAHSLIKGDNCLYIGEEETYTFTSAAPIVKYVDTEYPYVVDKEGKYYLLREKIISDYPGYEIASLITPNIQCVPETVPICAKFMNIVEFYIGEMQYTLRHTFDAASAYARIKKLGKLKLVFADGSEDTLDRKGYVKLMSDFGKFMGFYQFTNVIMYN